MIEIRTLPISDYKRLIDQAATPASGMFQMSFKGYAAEDVECEYCLHYGGKSKGCRIAKCCCDEEKQQAALTAAQH